jgi:6-phosphogluconolactonase/glucosamine-6-phosphate isomerase/deaminase
MGARTAAMAAKEIMAAADRGKLPVLWLMAAPSGFAFYTAFIDLCRRDKALASLMRRTYFFQFDDYPIGRGDPKFPITFRSLLETYFFVPLAGVCGPLEHVELMELTGGADDDRIAAGYAARVLGVLDDKDYYVLEIKGIGMDGHWGFHGSETPLDKAPGIIKVPMKGQNIHQQKIDWPQYFRTDADVPKHAYSFTVAAFMKADCVIDNVPQASKQYSVLASYGDETVLNDIPSSALKKHDNASAILTENSAAILAEYRQALTQTGSPKISRSMYDRLAALWDEPDNPAAVTANKDVMDAVLSKLGFI